MRNFDKEDKIKLLSLVKCRRLANKSLKFCFEEYAKESGKSVGSVKNFYYRIMSDKSGAKKLCEKLGISDKFMPIAVKEFSRMEKEELLKGILTGLSEGKSVRSCAFELSEGNAKLALRYQNKYYSLLKEDKSLVVKRALTIFGKRGKV